jgi:bacteriocin biosynthesis cyclodehydratase domain-containing protein
MLKHPRFLPHLRVEVVPGEGAYVLSDSRQTLLRGRLYERVVPWVGGGRSPEAVCDRLDGEVSPAEVFFVLAQLERKGFLCEANDALPLAEAALWSSQRVDPGEASRRLAETRVTVLSFGVEAGPFRELLRALHVRVEDEGALGVVLADGYLRGELEEVNAVALRDGRPWMLVRPYGRQVWVGPLFVPGVTGCWACLAQRLRANAPVESYLASRRGGGEGGGVKQGTPGPVASRATLQAAFGLAANAVAGWVARGGSLPELESKVRSLDLVSWTSQAHTMVRLPHCPACGAGPAPRPDEPGGRLFEFEDRPKAFTGDGGHRVVAPEVTLERYGHHVSPITGAVSALERVGASGDGAVHVYLAGHNLARRHHSLDHLRGDLRNMSSGKGASDAQARASGLCEGLERYSGVFRGDEPRRRARLHDLGGLAVHPSECLLFSERQYRERDVWNARESRFNYVPAPFDPDAEIEWSPAWSLTRGEARYLPTAFCYFNYPYRDGEPFCVACSNGNAAGNTVEEAVLQGFLELVERDAVALWWYNRVRRPAVDLAGFAEPYHDRLRSFLRSRGRDLWALDLTSDLGIPVFAALSRAAEGTEERIMLGFGAHLDARVALLRAVTEMSQMLAGLLQEPDPRKLPEHITDEETVRWLRTATLANQPYLTPDPGIPARVASDFPRAWSDDVTEDVRRCRAIVEGRGMEVFVLDQTRSEIGLPVVKVVVPGLRHFWARFAPGRLYDVPVRLGWLSRPTPEAELNPIPMFL